MKCVAMVSKFVQSEVEFRLFCETLSIDKEFFHKNQTLRSYRVYILPTNVGMASSAIIQI